MKCNTCANENYCYDGNHQLTRDRCADNGFTAYVPQTNADKIRSMSDWEMAGWLCDVSECDRRCPAKIGDCIFSDTACISAWTDWLKSPVEVDNG